MLNLLYVSEHEKALHVRCLSFTVVSFQENSYRDQGNTPHHFSQNEIEKELCTYIQVNMVFHFSPCKSAADLSFKILMFV